MSFVECVFISSVIPHSKTRYNLTPPSRNGSATRLSSCAVRQFKHTVVASMRYIAHVAVAVGVGVGVDVEVYVFVAVGVAVRVGVAVAVNVGVGVGVAVSVGV